ncbi:MAG: toll/interleukin-1 receptor domain-containing protein [Treponema sp.]|nr:toll/interleukin-1 receptor domain-containing protein [Treponema sp.]
MADKVFISWSSDDPRVQRTAENFQKWFLTVFRNKIEFFYSNDIAPGTHALEEINRQIDSAKFAFFFLSRRTARSSWVIFEAGCLRRLIDKGNAYFILTDISVNEFHRLCPPLAQYQASKLDNIEAVRAIARNICEKLEISGTEMLNINARAETEYAMLEKAQKEMLETVQLIPDAYTGLLPYGDTIECSSNFRMPRIFHEFQKELFMVGINMNFLLNLRSNPAYFIEMLKVLMANSEKKVNICISDVWEKHHAYCYNKIILNQYDAEMEGLTEVFKDKNSDIYLDTFIRRTVGDNYDQITKQLTIKKIEMLVDTFWFVDTDNVENSGNMMLIPMTSPNGHQRPVFFASQRNQPVIFNTYQGMCRAGFNSISNPVWPETPSPNL